MSLVKSFSQQIKTVTEVLKPLSVKVVALNRVESKFKSYGYGSGSETKGVDSDHIKIFDVHAGWSFAFAFNWQVGPESVLVSVKTGEEFKQAKYAPAAFRSKINEFLKLLKILETSMELKPATLKATVESVFIKGEELDVAAEMAQVLNSTKEEIAKLKELHQKQLRELRRQQKIVKEKEAEVQAAIFLRSQEVELQELRRRYEKAQDAVNQAEAAAAKKVKLVQAKQELRQAQNEAYAYDRQVNELIAKAGKQVSKGQRTKLVLDLSKYAQNQKN